MDESGILITGCNGQLGLALQQRYPSAKKADSAELDITDYEALRALDWTSIHTILNAAAYTNVDGAETREGRIATWQVNAVGASNLARIANEHDLTLLHISTDYVFDGTKNLHVESEQLAPLSVYGASKAAGEVAVMTAEKHYILRSSWVIGDGKNFVRTMLGIGQKGISPTVVADQVGRLTFTNELVRAIEHILAKRADCGIYNISNGGEPASWADITRAIFSEAGFDLTVTDTTTAEYFADKENVAPRPLSSTFDLSKIEQTGFKPRDWRIDLSEYIKKELSK